MYLVQVFGPEGAAFFRFRGIWRPPAYPVPKSYCSIGCKSRDKVFESLSCDMYVVHHETDKFDGLRAKVEFALSLGISCK
jgi:hypothetical protein